MLETHISEIVYHNEEQNKLEKQEVRPPLFIISCFLQLLPLFPSHIYREAAMTHSSYFLPDLDF